MWIDPASFTLERAGEEMVVHVRCALAAASAPALGRLVTLALDTRPRELAVDLGECPSIDYAGVRALILAQRQAASASAGFRVRRCSGAVGRVLRRLCLEGILNLPAEPSEPAAYRPNPRYCRFALREPVHLWDGLMHHTGETVGFSPEGLVLQAPVVLRVFQVVRLEMAAPDAGEPFRFTGRVVRSRPGSPALAEMEFLSVSPAMRVWLQQRTPGLLPPPPAPLRR